MLFSLSGYWQGKCLVSRVVVCVVSGDGERRSRVYVVLPEEAQKAQSLVRKIMEKIAMAAVGRKQCKN